MTFRLKLLNLKEENFEKGIFGPIAQPPLCHAFLAAMIPKDLDVDVQIIDEQIEPIDFDMDCDAVVLSLSTHIARKGYEYANEFKKRNRVVVMGGYHVSLCPDEAQQHADAISVGEAEMTWPQLVRDLVNGKVKKRYVSEGPCDLSATPIPRRDLFKREKYFVPNTIIATRGCPFMCSYCASSKIWGKHRRRKTEDVIKEIKSMSFKKWNEKQLLFVDDELFFPKEESIEFFRQLGELKIKWASQTTVAALFDKELIDAAAKSGCMGLMIGVESFNPETHKEIKKFQNMREGLDKAVEYANSLGIGVGALLIIGLDTDTPESVEATMKTLEKSKFGTVSFSILRAYPNTSIYKSLIEEDRIRKDWWLNKNPYEDAVNEGVPGYLEVYYKPKNFTPGELQIKALECESRANSIFSLNTIRNISRSFFKGDKFMTLRLVAYTFLVYSNAKMMLWRLRGLKKKKTN